MVARKHINVAIVGAGPGGLATAIALSELPYVSVTVYERAPEPREVGAGISIGRNGWNVLELLGAADGVKGAKKQTPFQRNGRTGEPVVPRATPAPLSPEEAKYESIRARRTRLQAALLARVPANIIRFNKKLVSLTDLGGEDREDGVRLQFQDATVATADLVVGADGIRSVVRQTLFPDHHLHFTGVTAWRVLVPVAAIRHVADFPTSTGWWHGLNGYFYFSHVDDEPDRELCEITVRSFNEPEVPGRTATWAIPSTNDRVRARCGEYDPRIQAVLDVVPEGDWREFAMAAGPCLPEIQGWDKVALIGDASHPLSGAFGSGAAFAMEDGWILARAIEHTITSNTTIKDALGIFQQIRAPYYERMHASDVKKARALNGDFDTVIKTRVASFGGAGADSLDWIYKNDIKQVWSEYVASETR
ncbi:FAD/NAD(P)-binding domain-containing protein [Aspergillus uvarum CBS 121591]|uniref:FAD/NAD(P)-binding domain-containing protein n=1 Tax=Aspergillus uvarum CBS 121591 TaxID=1448315 RepID=A0A319C7K3_9EURO|nr:FAD/NAD(P)-binding domain-containing protein [Aspergillus uvarum CBS 121591]PYH81796.1 FAD/NAD(P)-binding domain-containing protein [Aspergillus uvarum CBS 121591]